MGVRAGPRIRPPPGGSGAPDLSALTGKRVLVVDDNAFLALDLEMVLEESGCVVIGPAPTVEAALALVAAEPPDAAILDIDLGGSNSAPVADALAGLDVPFLFISGYGQDMVPTAHAGRPLLAKPWTENDLRDALDGLLRRG